MFQHRLEEDLAVGVLVLAEVLQDGAADARVIDRDGILQGCGKIGPRPGVDGRRDRLAPLGVFADRERGFQGGLRVALRPVLDDLHTRVAVGISRTGGRQSGGIRPRCLGILLRQCRDKCLAGLFGLTSAQARYGGFRGLGIFPPPLAENHEKRRVSLAVAGGSGGQRERALRVLLGEAGDRHRADLHFELGLGQRIREGYGPRGIFARDVRYDGHHRVLSHPGLLDADREIPGPLRVGLGISAKNHEQPGFPSRGLGPGTHLRGEGRKVRGLQPLLQVGIFPHGTCAGKSAGFQAGELGAKRGGRERFAFGRLGIQVLHRRSRCRLLSRGGGGNAFLHDGGSGRCDGGHRRPAEEISRSAADEARENGGDEGRGVFCHKG